MKVSLQSILVDLLEDYPGSTADELSPHCEGYTRKQIMQGLHNMAFAGMAIRKPQESRGRLQGRYFPTSASYTKPTNIDHGKPSPRAVASVFQLGDRACI